MIVLVFLYMVGVIFIIGAEINAALMKFRVRHLIYKGWRHHAASGGVRRARQAADIRD